MSLWKKNNRIKTTEKMAITPEEHELYEKVKAMRESAVLFNDDSEKRHVMDVVQSGLRKLPHINLKDI